MSLNRKARRHFESKSGARRTQIVSAATVGSVLASQVALLSPAAAASSVVVSKCTDSDPGSLRAAIETANGNADNTQVTFSVAPSCTSISLSSALPTITAPIDIKGPGANKLTLTSQGSNHIFDAYNVSSLKVSGLTLIGGGVRHINDLNPSSPSTDVIAGVVIKNVDLNSILQFSSDTVGSKVTVENSTFTDNNSDNSNGSGYLSHTYQFDLTFRNNTVVNNSFSESMIYSNSSDGSVLQANTIVSNVTGTIGNGETTFDGVKLFGNLIADIDSGIRVSGGQPISVCAQNVVDQGANLFDSQPTGCDTLPTVAQTDGSSAVISNLTGKLAKSIKVERGTTPTLALLAGSPALNYYSRGDSGAQGTFQAKDQRGLARPYGSGYDVGAVEYQPKTQPSVKPKKTKIHFNASSVILSKSQKAKIKKAVSSAGQDANYVITGSAGDFSNVPREYEKALAKKRANVVKKYLVKLGVSPKNIKIKTKIYRQGVKPVSVLDRYIAS